ncbi:MAG: hypothetical protein HY222_04335 [Thaumarchaeota archaeon]|nr:hypothetical protein [Nitrososphaerota archaeon]MBI3641603.1 hypothetical protein [Nitrososphaerota archaeon]
MTLSILELRYLIRNAMINKQLLGFIYDNQYVLGEPHVYGIKINEIHLLVYQISGQSNTGRLPKWRDTLAEKISNLRLLRYHFQGKRTSGIDIQKDFDKVLEFVG